MKIVFSGAPGSSASWDFILQYEMLSKGPTCTTINEITLVTLEGVKLTQFYKLE